MKTKILVASLIATLSLLEIFMLISIIIVCGPFKKLKAIKGNELRKALKSELKGELKNELEDDLRDDNQKDELNETKQSNDYLNLRKIYQIPRLR